MPDWPDEAAVNAMREAVARQEELVRTATAGLRGVRDVGSVSKEIARQVEGLQEKFAAAGITAGMTPPALAGLNEAFAKTKLSHQELERINATIGSFHRLATTQERMTRVVTQLAKVDALTRVSESVDAAFALQSLRTKRFAEMIAAVDVPAEAVADVDVGIELALESVLAEGPPDGIAGIPVVVEHLSQDRRRELLLRVATLLVMTALYIRALSIDEAEVEGLAGALLAAAWFYSSVVTAIDEADRALQDDQSP